MAVPSGSLPTRLYPLVLAFIVFITSPIFGRIAHGSRVPSSPYFGKVPMILPTTLKLSFIDYRSWTPLNEATDANPNAFSAAPPSFNCLEEWNNEAFFKSKSFVEYVVDAWDAAPLNYTALQDTLNSSKCPPTVRFLKGTVLVSEINHLITLLNDLALGGMLPSTIDAVHILIRDKQELDVLLRSSNVNFLKNVESQTRETWSWDWGSMAEWRGVVNERAQWLQLKNARSSLRISLPFSDSKPSAESFAAPASPTSRELEQIDQSVDTHNPRQRSKSNSVSFSSELSFSGDSHDNAKISASTNAYKAEKSHLHSSSELFTPSPSSNAAIHNVISCLRELSHLLQIDNLTRKEKARLSEVQEFLQKHEDITHVLMEQWTTAEVLPPPALLWENEMVRKRAPLGSPGSIVELSRNISDEIGRQYN